MCKSMNLDEAEKLALSEIEKANISDGLECLILKEKTIEKSWGWCFFYQSADFIKSGDFRDMLVGNAPVIVNKFTGRLTHTGTAHNIEYYLREYESLL